MSACGSSNPRKYNWILKLSVATWKSGIWLQKRVGFFSCFNFERNYDVSKSKKIVHFFEQKYKLWLKTKRNRKWKIPQTLLERRTLCFSWYKNRELKVKLWLVGARERKEECIFCNDYYLRGDFFKHFFFYLNVYSVLNKFSIYIFLYISKNITLYTSKIVESFHCTFKLNNSFWITGKGL